jgi:hypothetical protein
LAVSPDNDRVTKSIRTRKGKPKNRCKGSNCCSTHHGQQGKRKQSAATGHLLTGTLKFGIRGTGHVDRLELPDAPHNA